MDLTSLIEADKSLLLSLNGSDNPYADALAWVLTTATTWVPLYVGLFYIVMRNNNSVRKILLILAMAGLCVVMAGTLNDTFVKPGVARWRPTHDLEIGTLVDVVRGYRGGRHGFFSSHAANTMGVAVFFCMLVRSRSLSTMLILWALVNSWTRIYLGVHFPLDVACGLAWGTISGLAAWLLFRFIARQMNDYKTGFVSTTYTSTGYLKSDVDVCETIMALTLLYVAIRACIITV